MSSAVFTRVVSSVSRAAFAVSVFGLMAATPVMAADAPAWLDTVKLSGHLDAGMTFNADTPAGAENVGSLFTDKADQPMLNQLMATLERPIDTKSNAYDYGFKLQGMFGSDARYTHDMGLLDHLVHNRNQIDITEADLQAHLPILTEGGMDVKVGVIPSPMGAEVIDSTGNYLYSHSYIFNFGVPFKNTGVLSTLHVNSLLDLYAGLDTGVNAWLGEHGYNNDIIKGQFGFGLNMLDGALTMLGFTHIGAENPPSAGFPRDAKRYLNDITTTWKVNDNLTLVNDANYIADDGLRAIGYGMAQYGIYSLSDSLSLVARGEVWRDNNGSFVAAYPGSFDAINAQRGYTNTSVAIPRTTYAELTLGVNYKPEVPKYVDGLMIRPELRIDRSLSGTKPFHLNSSGVGQDDTSFTPAVDVVIPF